MKKILAAVFLVVLAATSSFGAAAASSASVIADAGKAVGFVASVAKGGTVGTAANAIGKLSTGVHLAWNIDTAAAPATYAIKTAHASGVRAFGTASDSTKITWILQDKGTVVAVPATPNVNGVLTTGWSVM